MFSKAASEASNPSTRDISIFEIHAVADLVCYVNASASTLRPGTHGSGIVFTNLSSGRGNTVRFARLIVRRPPPSRPTDQTERGSGGYLPDDRGGYLLEDRGRRLLAQTLCGKAPAAHRARKSWA